MISEKQMDRAEREFAANASASLSVARDAERELEFYTYSSDRRQYDPKKREQLFNDFQDADYMAESRHWILHLIREDRKRMARSEQGGAFKGYCRVSDDERGERCSAQCAACSAADREEEADAKSCRESQERECKP